MKLFNMKTRKMVDKSFSQYLVYQAFQAVTHDISMTRLGFLRPDVHARMFFMRYSAS